MQRKKIVMTKKVTMPRYAQNHWSIRLARIAHRLERATDAAIGQVMCETEAVWHMEGRMLGFFEELSVWCQGFLSGWHAAALDGNPWFMLAAAAGVQPHTISSAIQTCYINHGGVGFRASVDALIPVPNGAEKLALRLIATFDGAILGTVAAPADGWSHDALAKELESRQALILSFAPVCAYLGDALIGSTEV